MSERVRVQGVGAAAARLDGLGRRGRRARARVRAWFAKPESDNKARPALWALFAASLALIGFAYSGVPKGPLKDVLPPHRVESVVAVPTVADFVAERTALGQRLGARASRELASRDRRG